MDLVDDMDSMEGRRGGGSPPESPMANSESADEEAAQGRAGAEGEAIGEGANDSPRGRGGSPTQWPLTATSDRSRTSERN